MKEILMILPSRGRPLKVEDTLVSWQETSTGRSELFLCLDHDDPTWKDYDKSLFGEKAHGLPVVSYRIGPRLRVCPTVNKVVEEYPDYKYYGFLGDDHVFRTKGWEDLAINKIEENGGWGIVYGDDKFQGEKLATAAIMSANIPKTLGYMAIPGLTHLYMDNFWMEIGRGINRLFYIPEIVIEHMHFEAGKSPKDPQYAEVNSSEMYSHDGAIFGKWIDVQKAEDVRKLQQAMQ